MKLNIMATLLGVVLWSLQFCYHTFLTQLNPVSKHEVLL